MTLTPPATPTIGSLCSGYGGLDMGVVEATGGQVVWHAEVDPHASIVLEANWPDVPNLGDVIERDWSSVERVDVLTAGFPCQPVSTAGPRLGTADPRWLWPAVRDAIEALAPPVVFLENVANIASIHGGAILDLVTSDLAALRYRYQWVIMGACHVGAAHHRHRWFLRADRLAPGELASSHNHGERKAICGAPRNGTVLPTPLARDGERRRTMTAQGARARRAAGREMGLVEVVALMLPTPKATDTGTPGRRASEGFRPPLSQVLLPAERFGAYLLAVERQETAFRLSAPHPTEPNGDTSPRLSARFVEWLMGLPPEHVTGHVARNQALRICGNGVVPQQAAEAWRLLSERSERMSDTNPPGSPAPEPVEATEDAPHGMETTLGSMSRETLRAASPIVTRMREILTHHDSGTAATVLREVLAAIETAADAASRRRPRNRPAELAELSPAALRQLAALCRVWRADEESAPERTQAIEAAVSALPEPLDTEVVVIDSGGNVVSRGSTYPLAAIEATPEPEPALVDLMAERIGQQLAPDLPAGMRVVHDMSRILRDPFNDPAPYDPDAWFDSVPRQPVAAADPFSDPAPYTEPAPLDDIPF